MVELTVYDYYDAEDKAGNVRRVARKVADQPGPDPVNWSVEGTDFEYYKNGEVRMIIQRTWHESGTTINGDQLVSIHEVRGNGRRRHMLRPWGFEPDEFGGWNKWADNASALWTAYDGDEPTADYRMEDHDLLGLIPDVEKSYTLGLAQRTGEGEVKYFHTDHLGTTQAMTDASQTPEPRIVYTAFGEVISTSSPPDTRYQYVGDKGYESFAEVPFLHVGARWYDPASGRFLQRDPIGVRGGTNVYSYIENTVPNASDPKGLYTTKPPSRLTPMSPSPPSRSPFGGNFMTGQRVIPVAPAAPLAPGPRRRFNPLKAYGRIEAQVIYWDLGGHAALVGELTYVCSFHWAWGGFFGQPDYRGMVFYEFWKGHKKLWEQTDWWDYY